MLTRLTILDNTSIPVAAKGLDAYTLRGKAIADNIANVSTPGYRRIEVSFEDQLQKALNPELPQGTRTDANHMYLGRPELEHVRPVAHRVDEDGTGAKPGEINNVDIDMEMAKLAENQIQFMFAAQMIGSRHGTVEDAFRKTP
jgi:flagellar basal-body rod protein FlgB